jgi:hypothetical protein
MDSHVKSEQKLKGCGYKPRNAKDCGHQPKPGERQEGLSPRATEEAWHC